MICEVFLRARDAGALRKSQKHIADQADILIRGLAHVGIIALVDEATGYQADRGKEELQQILKMFILEEQARWIKRFPDEFFELLFEMKGWTWNQVTQKKPVVVGKYINDIVYARLAPNILDELKKKNPTNEKGRRKGKHHQWLTDDIGHPKLQQHLSGAMALMRASGKNWTNFKRMLERAYPKFGDNYKLPFKDDDEA